MIWFRRSLAVLLALVFIISFVLSLVLFRVKDTLLSPRFYTGELRKADIYNFAYDTALPIVIDQSLKSPNLPAVDTKAIKADALKLARQALPPEWVQTQTEQAINQIVPYVIGSTNQFVVTVPLNERVAALGQAVKTTVQDGASFEGIYSYATDTAADMAFKSLDSFSLHLKVTKNDLGSSIKTVVPKAWLATQIENATDQLVPYLQGKSEHFTITVPLADRVEAAAKAIKDLIHKGDASSVLIDEMLVPQVMKMTSQGVQLPYGVTVTQAEASTTLRAIFPPDWTEARLNDVVDATAAYFTGKAKTLSVTIPIADRKDAAYQAIGTLVDRKLGAAVNALPQCSLLEFMSRLPPPGQLPSCRPMGLTYEQVKSALGVNTTTLAKQVFMGALPDSITVNQASLQDLLGANTWRQVEDARSLVTKGFTYTDTDLRRDLKQNTQTLDDVLKYTRQGVTFTQKDLREAAGENLDQVRSTLGYVNLANVLWIWLTLLLAGIAFLGGRNWGSRLAWAAVILAIASLLLLVIAWPVYDAVAQPQVQLALAQASKDSDPSMAPLTAKATSMAQMVIDDFIAGIRIRAGLLALLAAAAALAGGIVPQVVSKPKPAAPKGT